MLDRDFETHIEPYRRHAPRKADSIASETVKPGVFNAFYADTVLSSDGLETHLRAIYCDRNGNRVYPTLNLVY